MADQINGRCRFTPFDQLKNSWMAFRLQDGSTDGTLYDSKTDAVRHTDETRCAYFCFRNAMGGVTPHDCQLWLDLHRHVYSNGGRLADPDTSHGGPDLILSNRGYDVLTGRIRP
jgi:hypothetical protein